MRKVAVIALCMLLLLSTVLVVFALGLAGGQAEGGGPQIAPMQLTADQREIVDLLSQPGQEILLFEYRLDERFTSLEFWVEVYRYGELVETVAGLRMYSQPPVQITDGQLAITIRETGNRAFQWTISSAGGSAQNSEPWVASEPYLARAFGPITEPVAIEDGQAVVLYTSLFSSSCVLSTFTDKQIYLEQPELLSQFPYVHMILARFTM